MDRDTGRLLIVLALLLLLLPACALTDLFANESPAPPTPTLTPKPTFTPTPGNVGTPDVAPSYTPTVTPSPQPTATPEPIRPTPTEAPTLPPTATFTAEPVQAVVNAPTLNVRRGPATTYPILGQVRNGERYTVTGRDESQGWWQIDYSGQIGWVSGDYVRVEGDVTAVATVADLPATPRPTPTSAPAQATPVPPTAAPTATSPPAPQIGFQLVEAPEHCRHKPDITYFEGYVRAADNRPLNNVCVHIAYHGPRQTICTGCDGRQDGSWSFSPFGGPAPENTPVEIFVVPCPESLPSGGQTPETGFGPLTPLSEKWTFTVVSSVMCTDITFMAN